MIDYQNWENVNELDEIIIGWHESNGVENMRYVCVEDVENKCWIVYDSKTGIYDKFLFGYFVESVINEYMQSDKKAVHHKKMVETARKHNIEYDEVEKNRLFEETSDSLSILYHIFENLSGWYSLAKKGQLYSNNNEAVSIESLNNTMLNEWKKFRFACFPNSFIDVLASENMTEEDFVELANISKCDDEKLEDVIEKLKKETAISNQESRQCLNKVVTRYFIAYHDYITFTDNDGKSITGRCFLTFNIVFLFYWDLFHILVSRKADTPHICPRCKCLFWSDNRTKYCDECKNEAHLVRNENRLKSVRYIHKKIYDKINNSKFHNDTEKELFLAESNYYWDIVRGKEVKKIPLFTAKIETEEQYKKWLEEKLNSI